MIESLTFRQAVAGAEEKFKKAGSLTPRLDAEILMAHACSADLVFVMMNMDDPLPERTGGLYHEYISCRERREPVAYITGKKEFYSIEFTVDPRVLIPRPETETLVDAALAAYGEDTRLSALDIGTGSGAIAVALAVHRPGWDITAVDISPEALQVAGVNVRERDNRGQVRLIQSDLFSALGEGKYDLIVSNPPYVAETSSHSIDIEAALYEPRAALFSGPAGLGVIEKIVGQAAGYLNSGGRIVMEIGDGQAEAARELFEREGSFTVENIINDLQGLPRVIAARKEN